MRWGPVMPGCCVVRSVKTLPFFRSALLGYCNVQPLFVIRHQKFYTDNFRTSVTLT